MDRDEFLKRMAVAKSRRAKRRAKGIVLGLRDVVGRTELKANIVKQLGLLDKMVNGSRCRIHQTHCASNFCAYHLIPQQRGDAARFYPPNVVHACTGANFGEKNNRSLYAEKHEQIFGIDRMKAIKLVANMRVSFSRQDLFDIRDRVNAEIITFMRDRATMDGLTDWYLNLVMRRTVSNPGAMK